MDGMDLNRVIIQLEAVHFAYRPHGTVHAPPLQPVLSGVDLILHEGERLCLTGENGCGKTTLLHLIVGLLLPTAGTVTAFGKLRSTETDFHEVRRRAGRWDHALYRVHRDATPDRARRMWEMITVR